MDKRIQWIEVWIDDASAGEYILILRSFVDGSLEVVNPYAQNEVIKIFHDYEEAKHWFNEDEYDLIEGRWFVEN